MASRLPNTFNIDPPLLNSASPWATTIEDLRALYYCEYTGAVTTRTSLLEGFPHDDNLHQYAFFDPKSGESAFANASIAQRTGPTIDLESTSSLNTLGYSPLPLKYYLHQIHLAAQGNSLAFISRKEKPIIISVTGTAGEVADCYEQIAALQCEHEHALTLMMEINLSCPNIPNKLPPAYDGPALGTYLHALIARRAKLAAERGPVNVLCGIKTPPYTFSAQYQTLISELETSAICPGGVGCPMSFITATNTLGSCLLLSPSNSTPASTHSTTNSTTYTPTLAPVSSSSISSSANSVSPGIGGLAGSALHPLSLGNVFTLRKALDESSHPSVQAIKIIGVGGVSDALGAARMRAVGAAAVGVGTALGRLGVAVFEGIGIGIGTESVALL